MGDDRSAIDELGELLNRCLGRIGTHLDQFSATRQPEDLEPLIARMDEEAKRVEALVSLLCKSVEQPRLSRADIDLLVREISDDVLSSLEAPLVIRTQTPNALPNLSVHLECLRAALRRAIVLGAAHAGPGGEVTISTRGRPKAVVFELAAIPGGSDRQPPVFDRSATLERFVEELGGHCSASVDEREVLHLNLAFTTEVEHA